MNQLVQARHFQALHQASRGFLLPNAWDAASARLFEAAGFPAIGTTSAGIAYARGRRDGQQLSREDMLREIAGISVAVSVPVTADVEAGYGNAPADVARTVRGAVNAGAVGINLEDGTGRPGPALYDLDAQQRRLTAARFAASEAGLPVILNARTDTYLTGYGQCEAERYAETVRRGCAYLEAGADLVFVPGLTDLPTVAALVRDLQGPLNVMVGPGAADVPRLLDLGVTRVSVGQGVMLAALGVVAEVARELMDHGTYTAMERSFYGLDRAEALFALPARAR